MAAETINQAYIFIVFILSGICIGLLFDFFRILRRSFPTNDLFTYLEDMIFWILTGILLLYFLFIFNNGNLRMYLFLAIAIGILGYMTLLSKRVVKISVAIIHWIECILVKIGKIVFYPFQKLYQIAKKIIFKPIFFVFFHVRNFTSKKMHLCLKIGKNYCFSRKKKEKKHKCSII